MHVSDERGSVDATGNPPSRVASLSVAAIAALLLAGGSLMLGLQSCAQTPEARGPAQDMGMQPLQPVSQQPEPVVQHDPGPPPQPIAEPRPIAEPQPDPQPKPDPFPGLGSDPEPQPKPQPRPRPDPRPIRPPPPT